MLKKEIYYEYANAYALLNITLFDRELPAVWIGFVEDAKSRAKVAKTKRGAFCQTADTGEPMIYFSSYPENGIDIDDLNVLFHEMAHLYAQLHGIKDVDKSIAPQYHTRQFKDVIEAHRGICRYSGAQYGFSDTELPLELLRASLRKIKSISEERREK